jgi:hypothetical protein
MVSNARVSSDNADNDEYGDKCGGVTVLLKRSCVHSGVTVVLQWCYSGVTEWGNGATLTRPSDARFSCWGCVW